MVFVREFINWWTHIFEKPDAYVALFTALLFISTAALWWATRKLWRVTDRSLTELERPYLFILDTWSIH